MIYKGKGFVDTSQIIQNNYNIYQENDEAPLLLQPKFAQKDMERVYPKSESTYFPREIIWRDSSASILEKQIKDLFGEFLVKWEEPLSYLANFIKGDVNPALEKPSGHSVFTAFVYLFTIYQIQPELCPELAMSGDGGLYIDCQLEDKFVSIQIDREASEKDRIYVEQGNNYGSTKLKEESIREVFSR